MNDEDIGPLFAHHSATSKAAADAIKPNAETLRAKVRELLEFYTAGLTDEQMQTMLKMNPSTQRPRRVELVRSGVVKDSGRTAPTKSGRQATIWVVA